MDTPEQVPPQKKRGRKPKELTMTQVEVGSPLGEAQKRWAEEAHDDKLRNPIVDKYYELVGTKLRYVKVKKSGRTISEYVGNIAEKKKSSVEFRKRRQELLEHIDRLKKEGRLRIKVG